MGNWIASDHEAKGSEIKDIIVMIRQSEDINACNQSSNDDKNKTEQTLIKCCIVKPLWAYWASEIWILALRCNLLLLWRTCMPLGTTEI